MNSNRLNLLNSWFQLIFIHIYIYSRYEQEKFRIMIENGQLEKDKLQRESNWMEVQVQLAQTELALKKQECQEKENTLPIIFFLKSLSLIHGP